VTERERAEAVVRFKQRQWVWNAVGLTALVLSIGLAILAAWDWQQRAEAAETSVVSMAERVQDECDTNGELRIDGRDLCDLADDVVQDPASAPVPAAGRDGTDGRDGIDGVNGKDGRGGKDGRPGKDGADGDPGGSGDPGVNGVDGEPGTDGVDGTNGTDGKDGADGAPGADGQDGADGAPGTALPGTYACPDDEYVAGFTVANDGAVTLSCRSLAPPPVIDPPNGG
jgi:hypothetical protein